MSEYPDYYPDDALPVHHLDDGPRGEQRGVCTYSGQARTDTGGCPRGCEGATEHYANDGHRACADEVDEWAAGAASTIQ